MLPIPIWISIWFNRVHKAVEFNPFRDYQNSTDAIYDNKNSIDISLIEWVMQTHKFDFIHNSVWSFLNHFLFACVNSTESFVNYLKSLPNYLWATRQQASSSPCRLHICVSFAPKTFCLRWNQTTRVSQLIRKRIQVREWGINNHIPLNDRQDVILIFERRDLWILMTVAVVSHA